jgi:hypothetical protein
MVQCMPQFSALCPHSTSLLVLLPHSGVPPAVRQAAPMLCILLCLPSSPLYC